MFQLHSDGHFNNLGSFPGHLNQYSVIPSSRLTTLQDNSELESN